MDEPPPSPAPSQAPATPRPRVLDEVLPPEERSALATSIRILRPPGTSRKERVQQLDQLAASGERAGAAGLAQLFAEHDGLWETLLEQCLHKEPLVRVYALRALRKLALDTPLAKQLFEHQFVIPLMRAFDTDSISLTFSPRADKRTVKEAMMRSEKLQALKLIVHLVHVAAGALPRGVCMLLISVAEDRKSEDTQFRRMCLETLRDLMVRNTKLVANCNGVQSLIKEMLSTDNDAFAQSVAYNLLYVLNDPDTRCLIRPDDMRMLFAPFTDSDVKVDDRRKEQLECSSRVIVTMMRSWTGLFFLCSDEFGLQTLVKTLLLPERKKIKQAIFKTIVNILRIAAPNVSTKTMGPPEFGAFSPAGSMTPGTSRSLLSPTTSMAAQSSNLAPRSSPKNLLDNYAAVLVLALVHAGLLEALQRLGEGFDVEIASLANELMSDLMDLSDQLFPRNMCLALHRLPRLVSDACDFRPGADALARERACIVVTHLQKYGAGQVGSLEVDDHERAATASQLRWIREQVDSRMQNDKWIALRNESKVDTVSYKECEEWDWEKLSDMVNGPLRNPTRLRELLKTDFIKAVLSVILPSKQRLEQMRRSPDTGEFIKVECQLLELLILSDEARKHKTFVRLMQELKELLDCEWKQQGKYSLVFAPRNFTDRVVRDFFTIIGTITSTPLGRDLLDDLSTGVSGTSTTKLLLSLCTRPARLDITKTIVSSLHYEATHDNHEILQVVLTAREPGLRLSATQHLLHLCRAGTAGFTDWGIDSLVTQLNDVDDTVVQMALDILLEACDIEDYLNAAVMRNPTQRLSQLSKKATLPLEDSDPDDSNQRVAAAAHDMLLRFAGHNIGVTWLEDLPRDSQGGDLRGWINVEIEEWDKSRNVEYVEQVEAQLVNVLRNDVWDGPATTTGGGSAAGVALKHVALPTHLYGQLGATANGCQLLRQTVAKLEKWAGLLDGTDGGRDSNAQRRHASDRELRAALWVIGHVGASEDGWSLLKDTLGDVMETVVRSATSSHILSMRGTCLYIVGMLSTTAEARERLIELKWARADERSVAVPDAIHASSSRVPQLFSVPTLPYAGSWARQCATGAKTPADTAAMGREADECVRRGQLSADEGVKVKELLGHAADMQNTVMLQEGKAGLLAVKREMPRLFTKPIVLVLLYSMMDGAPLALRVRRFLQRLFERVPVTALANALLGSED
jgi:rapamycin-insensitive companion of mTOR